ncbi:MAG: DUF6247 family protein [Pseudonocardiaceae bacterium]|nr:DUF6247 family protein [Pseudonocardia sp.]
MVSRRSGNARRGRWPRACVPIARCCTTGTTTHVVNSVGPARRSYRASDGASGAGTTVRWACCGGSWAGRAASWAPVGASRPWRVSDPLSGSVSCQRCGRCFAVSGNEPTQVATGTPDYTARSVERSGPAIRAALLAYAPERCAQFEAEFRSALALAADSLDLSGPQAVLKHWQAVAMMAVNPLTDDERELIARLRAGDYTGLSTRDENGNWVLR